MDPGTGLDLYIVEGTKPGFVYQVEAFDPEDTSQNLPLSVSFLIKWKSSFSVWPGVSVGRVGKWQWEGSAVHLQAQSTGEAGIGEGSLETDIPHWIHASVQSWTSS